MPAPIIILARVAKVPKSFPTTLVSPTHLAISARIVPAISVQTKPCAIPEKAVINQRLQRALTTGLPVATGLASSLVFSALLYSGGVGLIAGAAVSGVTSLACYLINRYVFGNKDQEIDSEEQNKQADKKQVVQEEASV